MQKNKFSLKRFVAYFLFIGFLWAIPDRTFAYIDPSLGGTLFQMFYLVFVGAVLFVATPLLFFWRRIKKLFGFGGQGFWQTTQPESSTVTSFKLKILIAIAIGAIVGLLLAFYDIAVTGLLSGNGFSSLSIVIDLILAPIVVYAFCGIVGMVMLAVFIFFLEKFGGYWFDKKRYISLQTVLAVFFSSSFILANIFGVGIKFRTTNEGIAVTFVLSCLTALGVGMVTRILLRWYSARTFFTMSAVVVFLLHASLLIRLVKPLGVSLASPHTFVSEATSSSNTRPNILWIVLDTARADHFSSYGYERNTTPNIDAFAKEGVLYKNVITTASWSLPSHASMFTGLYPTEHGANFSWSWLGDDLTTVAEVLRGNGYRTISISNNNVVGKQTNLIQGFEHAYLQPQNLLIGRAIRKVLKFFNIQSETLARVGFLFPRDGLAEYTNTFVRTIIDKVSQEQRPFFLFVNYMDAHEPYGNTPWGGRYLKDPTGDTSHAYQQALNIEKLDFYEHLVGAKVLQDADKETMNALYDGDLAYLDSKIGELISYLREHKVLDETLVIITADHGENLGENNLFSHVNDLHRTVTHVPLIIRYPKLFPAGTAEEGLVQTTDIPSTILEIVEVPDKDKSSFRGLSFLGGSRRTAAFSEGDFRQQAGGGEAIVSLTSRFSGADQRIFGTKIVSMQTDKYEYIRNSLGVESLFQVKLDPLEQNNLAASEQQKLNEMRHLLEQFSKTLRYYWKII